MHKQRSANATPTRPAAIPEPPTPSRAAWPLATRVGVAAGLITSLALLLLHAAHYRFLTDDAFISFRYARNLAAGHGLVFNPGFERVEGYSDFLWVVLLAAIQRLGLPPEQGAVVLSIAATIALWAMVAAFALRGARSARTAWVVVVPVALLAATRSIAVWSTGGLETRWFEMCVVGGTLRLVVELEARLRHQRPRVLAPWCFGLAALTRPDGALLAVAAAGAGALALRFRRLSPGGFLRQWWPLALLVGGQLTFRRLYYGDWLPNTYYVKVDSQVWWDAGVAYLAAFTLEYAAVLWLPLLAAAVVAHRARRTLFVPGLFAAMLVPHALYVTAIGGDHFEYRPLDLMFPLVFLLLADGIRHDLERPRREAVVALQLAAILFGLWWLPWRSHREYPRDYRTGFPGESASAEARAWLSPERDPVFRVPGLREIAAAHRRLLGYLSARYVGLRAEEHRMFLATVVPEGLRLRALMERGTLPRDLHIAIRCVGAIPYYSDARTLDLHGLTDRSVAHLQFRRARSMGHDKLAPESYLRERDVDLRALTDVYPFLPADSDPLIRVVMNAVARGGPGYAADVGDGALLLATFPIGTERAFARMPRLKFQRLADSSFAYPVLRRAAAAYRDSVARRPEAIGPWVLLGDLLLAQDDVPAAAAAYERALALARRDGEQELVRRLEARRASLGGRTAPAE